MLTEAAYKGPTPRERRKSIKDDHSDPILMSDLIYAFTGSGNYGSAKDTSQYKDCKIEGGVNIPFNQVRLCAGYDQEVRERYAVPLARMDEFVSWHIDPGAKDWFVKAVLDIIQNDIDDEIDLFVGADGAPKRKASVMTESSYDLSSFLVGILHFITSNRREQNYQGETTLDAIGEKKNRKPRRYTGNLGSTITRTIDVDFLPSRTERALEEESVCSEPVDVELTEEIDPNNEQFEYGAGDGVSRDEESCAYEENKTTVIHQQTNVIQNGDNNVNVTNNGTMTFNF